MTGLPASRTRFTSRQIVSDATAEPPGESTRNSTALAWSFSPRRPQGRAHGVAADLRARAGSACCGRRRSRRAPRPRPRSPSRAACGRPPCAAGVHWSANSSSTSHRAGRGRRRTPRRGTRCGRRVRRRGPRPRRSGARAASGSTASASRPRPVAIASTAPLPRRLDEAVDGLAVLGGELGALDAVGGVLVLVALVQLRLDADLVQRPAQERRLGRDPDQADLGAGLHPDLAAGRWRARSPACRPAPRPTSRPRPRSACRSRRTRPARPAAPA